MASVLRTGHRANHNLNTIVRSYSSMRGVDVRTAIAGSYSIKPCHANTKIHRRYYAAENKPQGDWVGGDKVGGDKINQGSFSRFNKAGRDSWNTKVVGISGIAIVLIGGGYVYCKNVTDHKACAFIREKLGIKKD
jgi:hypothetical protein